MANIQNSKNVLVNATIGKVEGNFHVGDIIHLHFKDVESGKIFVKDFENTKEEAERLYREFKQEIDEIRDLLKERQEPVLKQFAEKIYNITNVNNMYLKGTNLDINISNVTTLNIIQELKSKGIDIDFVSQIVELTKNFEGRINDKEFIKTHIDNNSSGYLFIKGQAGIGKSSLMGQIYLELVYERELKFQTGTYFIPYFFQQGSDANKINNFFETLKTELDKIYQTGILEGNNEMDRSSDFNNKLKKVSNYLLQYE